jgi:hypothetical protein
MIDLYMRPINERADMSVTQNVRGGEHKQPLARSIQRLCEELDLSPPQ